MTVLLVNELKSMTFWEYKNVFSAVLVVAYVISGELYFTLFTYDSTSKVFLLIVIRCWALLVYVITH